MRNSDASAVVEGTGDHACEYMTGGVAVILGDTGRNFGAGMTNGVAYVYDPANKFEHRYNSELIKIERLVEAEDSYFLRQLVLTHAKKTASTHAWDVLENWSLSLLYFWKVEPRSKPRGTHQPATEIATTTEPAKV